MKSSTIRRSTLSRETMEVIENLSKEQDAGGLPNEYVRPEEIEASKDNSSNKSQEIDLLWQSFKSAQFNSKSPALYVVAGFLAGVIVTVGAFAIMGSFGVKSDIAKNVNKIAPTLEQQADNAQNSVDNKVSIPEDSGAALQGDISSEQTSGNVVSEYKNSKTYIVQSGDTGESIIRRHYGSYSPEKAELIIKANNLSNFDKLDIGQELIIPMEE